MRPEQKRAIAKEETINPTAALFTPNDLVKSGIAGTTIPNPTATKNAAPTRTLTSRGRPARSFCWINQAPRQQLLLEQPRNHDLYEVELREALAPGGIQEP